MTPPSKSTAKGAGVGAAAMLAIASLFTPIWEGTETKPYFDRIGGLWTVCTGETNVEMREYSEAECRDMFGKSFMTYANAVAKASPGIEASPYEWAAHSDLAYNVGVGTYRKSSVSRLFNQGKRVEACRAMRLYKYAGGRVIKGLQYRREGEGSRIGSYELCLVGAVPADLGA